MSEPNAGASAGLADGAGQDVSSKTTDATDEDESSPAEDFGIKLGVPLAIVAIVWAFVGPANLLEVGRYELPVVASFVEPLPYTFFAYIAAVTFVLALVGALVFPSRVPGASDDYAHDLAMGLIIPPVVAVVGMVALGFLVPAAFYAVTGELTTAGMIVLGMIVVGVGAFILQTIVILAVAVASAPLWAPAFAGAYVGTVVRRVGA